MPLSWNEIKARAVAFSREWADERNEDAEAKSFWDSFFNIFGISRRRVATFEQFVRKIDNQPGFIDLLWKGVILVEHKTRGQNLDRAYKQATGYFPGLKEKELPKYVLVCDFANFRLYDLENSNVVDFALSELLKYVHHFAFIAGYQKRTYKEQDPVNIEAAEYMGKLHDQLKTIGYSGHQLEVYLVRLVFCLFADDTNIFEKGIFYDFINLKTTDDGSDLAAQLDHLFQILNTHPTKRLRNLDESLAAFPYVNGKLFEERLSVASFDSSMRQILLECCLLDWSKISPAIFGSLFQSVMDAKARRQLGAHYTSEKNIMKLIKPLFLDSLWNEYQDSKTSKTKLQRFHEKISNLRFLDPACGCGNFLIIAYREIRLLEIEIIKTLLFKHEKIRTEVAADAGLDVGHLIKCDVDRFYGIEFEEFPAQIAQVAMWLIDHQMNLKVSETFGDYYVRLPLQKSAAIKNTDALEIDWQRMMQEERSETQAASFDYIFGNPPFIGSKYMTEFQRQQVNRIFHNLKGSGTLDYVCAWYMKAIQYINNHSASKSISCAFVSTNSICQGEQTGILWHELILNQSAKINFAHRTFKWGNEARGNAAVHVVIVGFSNKPSMQKRIFEYTTLTSEPHEVTAKNINPYLIDTIDVFIKSRNTALCETGLEIGIGNKPIDDGNYLFTKEEKEIFLKEEPEAERFFKRWLGSEEFINGLERWVLWLGDADPHDLRHMPAVLKRIEAVRKFRRESKSKPTQDLANRPTRFHVENFPRSKYLIIPEVSSERRHYIPIGYIPPSIFSSNLVKIVKGASIYHFGILTSQMHMTWVKYVGGRLKSDYRYSKDVVFNNFPWPVSASRSSITRIEAAAEGVLSCRATFPDNTLADLYDPNSMPSLLAKAHQDLDKAVDRAYKAKPFPSETARIEFLFNLYNAYEHGIFTEE